MDGRLGRMQSWFGHHGEKKYLPTELGLLGHLTFTIITLPIKPSKTTNQS